MGRGLYGSEPTFRSAFDDCADALASELGFDLRERAFADDAEALLPTAIMQPATFAIEYALARVWLHRGVAPAAMIGHSVGEFVAATLAGVFALPDALRLVARRGALMQAQPPGGMLSVRLTLEALLSRMPPDVSLAAENAPGSCVVAGALDALARFQAQLEADGVACRALRTSHAFHSPMMEPVVAPFRDEVAAMKLSAPMLPLVSTATGDWLDAAGALSPDYWASHLREPVRFASALGKVLDTPSRVLLEVGPRASLSALSRQHPGVQQHHIAAVATLADVPAVEPASLRLAAGQLWARGVAVDPAMFDDRSVRRRVRLPTYPFERQRFWVEAPSATASNVVALLAGAQHAGSATIERDATMPHLVVAGDAPIASRQQAPGDDRGADIVRQLKAMFEDMSGIGISDGDENANFIELGLDSLMLTQIASQLQKTFATRITFRQLMGECASLERLAAVLAQQQALESVHVPTTASAATAPVTPEVALPAPTAFAFSSHALAAMDAAHPIMPGARLGREPDGRPAWFIADPARSGRFLKVGT
jgi:acyl transferase domain-containing protein